jgi:hypothetical protein
LTLPGVRKCNAALGTFWALQLERRELMEVPNAIGNFAALQLQQTIQAKFFHGETS